MLRRLFPLIVLCALWCASSAALVSASTPLTLNALSQPIAPAEPLKLTPSYQLKSPTPSS